MLSGLTKHKLVEFEHLIGLKLERVGINEELKVCGVLMAQIYRLLLVGNKFVLEDGSIMFVTLTEKWQLWCRYIRKDFSVSAEPLKRNKTKHTQTGTGTQK